jgi:hypothetical protein
MSAERVKGWLFFNASKKEVKFVSVDEGSEEDVPWEIFADSDSDSLLWNFIEDFQLKRERSPGTVFCYHVDCDHDAINTWLRERCEVIDIAESVGEARMLA